MLCDRFAATFCSRPFSGLVLIDHVVPIGNDRRKNSQSRKGEEEMPVLGHLSTPGAKAPWGALIGIKQLGGPAESRHRGQNDPDHQ